MSSQERNEEAALLKAAYQRARSEGKDHETAIAEAKAAKGLFLSGSTDETQASGSSESGTFSLDKADREHIEQLNEGR